MSEEIFWLSSSKQKSKRDKKQSKKTMIIFYSERAKRARKIFGKVLRSKRLRMIKTELKTTTKI